MVSMKRRRVFLSGTWSSRSPSEQQVVFMTSHRRLKDDVSLKLLLETQNQQYEVVFIKDR